MTEAVRQSSSISAVSPPVRPPWRTAASTTLNQEAFPVARRHGSLSDPVQAVYVTSVGTVDNPQGLLKEQNVNRPPVKIPDELQELKRRCSEREEMISTREACAASSSSRSEPSRHSSLKKDRIEEIKWQNFEDSEDEETSEDYEDADEDTDDDDAEKPGLSDTETKNLLDAAEEEEDVDSDDGDTVDAAQSSGSSKIYEVHGEAALKEKCARYSADELITLDDDSLYEMSDQQKEYYTKCFAHLMKITNGHFDIDGAVHGANEHVVEFFKKSELDTDSLSKIWALSDVNEDGYLDHAEFSVAMHLIVLRVKGNIAIPDRLPSNVRPPVMPARNAPFNKGSANLDCTSGKSAEGGDGRPHTAKTPQSWRQFDFDDPSLGVYASQQQHSLSDDHLHLHNNKIETPEKLSDFSDVPPLLVDGRPTALKATQPLTCSVDSSSSSFLVTQYGTDTLKMTLSPQGPKGPPPKPPPRPVNKGHGRSASLDLNTFTAIPNGVGLAACGFSPATAGQRGATLPSQPSIRYFPSTSVVADPPRLVPPPSTGQQASRWTPPLALRGSVGAPPLPRRSVADIGTQTEVQTSMKGDEMSASSSSKQQSELIEFNVDMEKRIEELLANETLAMSGGGGAQVNWKERCAQLRKTNAELEIERAKLAQICLQLEVRLHEAIPNAASAKKPTSL